MNFCFFGKRALILGGSSDLALSLAETMIKEGLFPILTCRSEKAQNYITESLNALDGRYSTVYLNLSEPGSIGSALENADRDIDYLVDFAQGDFESLIASAEDLDIYQYFSENVSFRAEVIKKVARIMLAKKKGRMIYISSSAAAKPNPGQGFYAAAKLASEALYRNLGLELGGRGITTVTLRPGYINAGRGRSFLGAQSKEALRKVPIKRALTVDEVSETILFYLSDSASGFNATEISMDGGLSARK